MEVSACGLTEKGKMGECIGRSAFGLVRDARYDAKRYQKTKGRASRAEVQVSKPRA